MVTKLKCTQKELDNKLRQIANQIDHDGDAYKWKEGLRIQYKLGGKLLTKCRAAATANGNQQRRLVSEYLQSIINAITRRNKELRITDESEGGWETVAAYRSHPVADNSKYDKEGG